MLLRFRPTRTAATKLVETAAVRGVPLTAIDIDNLTSSGLYEPKLVLVHPDGHVVWREDVCPTVRALLSTEFAVTLNRALNLELTYQGGLFGRIKSNKTPQYRTRYYPVSPRP